jgi:hypothetical protein
MRKYSKHSANDSAIYVGREIYERMKYIPVTQPGNADSSGLLSIVSIS